MAQNPDTEQPSASQMQDEKRPDNDTRKRRSVEPEQRAALPEKPLNFMQKLNAVQLTKTLFFWSLAAAIILTMFVGFTWGGWQTASAAQKMADTAATDAVTQRLAPICVAQFNLDPARDEKLTALQEASSYARAAYVTEQTWATMPGESEANRQVAAACATLLAQIGQ